MKEKHVSEWNFPWKHVELTKSKDKPFIVFRKQKSIIQFVCNLLTKRQKKINSQMCLSLRFCEDFLNNNR